MSKLCTIVLISHASKVMLKIFQARLQQYVNQELPDVQGGFQKGRGARDQIANIHWIIETAREFQKNIYFCFTFYAKAFDFVDRDQLWKILKGMGVPDHLTCLLRTWMWVKKQQNWTWNNWLVWNWERSMTRLYIVILFVYMQITSCEIQSWINHKLESILLGEITTSDMQMIPL